jgi:hypothetical protein
MPPGAIAALGILVVVVAFTIQVVADLARARRTRLVSREAWLVICVLSMPIGGILYLMYGKDRGPNNYA